MNKNTTKVFGAVSDTAQRLSDLNFQVVCGGESFSASQEAPEVGTMGPFS